MIQSENSQSAKHIFGNETVKVCTVLAGSSDAEFTLYMFVYIAKQELCATELEKSQYVDANNHTGRNTHPIEEENKRRQAAQALATLTHDTFLFMSWGWMQDSEQYKGNHK